MSDFAQYPYAAMQAVGRSLSTISDRIGADSKNAFEIAGLTADQNRIDAALRDFRTEWEASVKKLGENIGGFGDTSTEIGVMSGQFDDELAKSLSPGSSDGPRRGTGSSRAR